MKLKLHKNQNECKQKKIGAKRIIPNKMQEGWKKLDFLCASTGTEMTINLSCWIVVLCFKLFFFRLMLFFQYLFFIYEDFLTLTQHLCHCPYAFHSTFSRAIFSHAPAEERAKKNESAISKTVAGSEKSKDWIYFSFAVCLLNFHKNNRIYAKMRDRNWQKKYGKHFVVGEKKKERKNMQFSRILKSSIRNVKTEKWSSIGIESETEHFLRWFFLRLAPVLFIYSQTDIVSGIFLLCLSNNVHVLRLETSSLTSTFQTLSELITFTAAIEIAASTMYTERDERTNSFPLNARHRFWCFTLSGYQSVLNLQSNIKAYN